MSTDADCVWLSLLLAYRLMMMNRLKLNADMTHFYGSWLGSRNPESARQARCLSISTSVVEFESAVMDLGVVLSME